MSHMHNNAISDTVLAQFEAMPVEFQAKLSLVLKLST